MKLHIGGHQSHPDWKILDVQPGPHVDFVGTCTDLSRFAAESIDTIYASHVFEHLSYRSELPVALKECRRVLKTGGELMISVPDLWTLCQIFVSDKCTMDQRFIVMKTMYGDQVDAFDFHKVGFIAPFLAEYLKVAGYKQCRQVEEFKLFDDASAVRFGAHLISLNMIATK